MFLQINELYFQVIVCKLTFHQMKETIPTCVYKLIDHQLNLIIIFILLTPVTVDQESYNKRIRASMF